MKRSWFVLCSLAIILCFSTPALALTFTDTQDLGVYLGEGPYAESISGSTYTYSHETPDDFEIPFDTVIEATLVISGYWINGDDDVVEISGTAVGTLESGDSFSFLGWTWTGVSLTVLDISSIFSSWTTGADLDVTIAANGDMGDGWLYLASSTFSLEYENKTAPVPEPATMFLLGSGLLGLAAANRKRLNKKS